MYCFEACSKECWFMRSDKTHIYAFLCAYVRLSPRASSCVCVCSLKLLCFIQFHFSLHGCCSATTKSHAGSKKFNSCILLVPFTSLSAPPRPISSSCSLSLSLSSRTHIQAGSSFHDRTHHKLCSSHLDTRNSRDSPSFFEVERIRQARIRECRPFGHVLLNT